MTISNYLHIFILLFRSAHAQSTSANPPGQCAGYINRYTHEDQCVYSFTVPKQHQNDCKGIEADVTYLLNEVEKLKAEMEKQADHIQLLNSNAEAFRLNGEYEAQIRRFEQDNQDLTMKSAEMEQIHSELTRHNAELQAELDHKTGILEEVQMNIEPKEVELIKMKNIVKTLHDNLELKEKEVKKLSTDNQLLLQARNCTEINKHLPSCDAIRLYGYKKSGYMMIDPDGEGGEDPFQVYCDMDLTPGRGITMVTHTNAGIAIDVRGCDDPGCFSHGLDYQGVSMNQIKGLVERSIHCQQYIRYDCFDSKLLKDGTAWWVSRDGRRQTYWGGAAIGSGMCSCGMQGNCDNPNEVCNCDSDEEKQLFDEGYIVDKDTLPIKEVRYGDVKAGGDEYGSSTVGKLECKWDYLMAAKSCEELGMAGVTKSGQYWIDPDGPTGQIPAELRVCEFAPNSLTRIPGDPTTIIGTGVAKVEPEKPTQKKSSKIWKLTDCGQTGRFGPTSLQCNDTYAGSSMETVEYMIKSGRQFFFIPETGRYRITAIAPGGLAKTQKVAGRGARLSGIFNLDEGDELRICVGQKGDIHLNKHYYGGSGGTFVVKFKEWVHIPLLIAGGGGSVAGDKDKPNGDISDANLAQFGRNGSKHGRDFGVGGDPKKGGLRGGRARGTNTPGGGAGYEEDGQPTSDTRFMRSISGGAVPIGAQSFMEDGEGDFANCNGGLYVDNDSKTINGGFGGGGSGARYAAGGGGGYGGGGGGPDEGYAGGGGSFIDPNLAEDPKEEVINYSGGEVIIELL